MSNPVSVVIPTAGATGSVGGDQRVFVTEAVRSVIRTGGPNVEAIVVVTDDRCSRDVRSELVRQGAMVVLDDRPFNFSSRINLGVAVVTTPQVLLLNDDIEAGADGWLDEMASASAVAGGGPVGACLVYEDGRVQHLGQVFAAGLPGHLLAGRPLTDPRVIDFRSEDRVCSALTAACLLMGVELFGEVGGMSPAFPINYNDTDLCLKARRSGARCTVATGALLSHYESRSRDAAVTDAEIRQLWRRWWGEMHHEEYWRDDARALARQLGLDPPEDWT